MAEKKQPKKLPAEPVELSAADLLTGIAAFKNAADAMERVSGLLTGVLNGLRGEVNALKNKSEEAGVGRAKLESRIKALEEWRQQTEIEKGIQPILDLEEAPSADEVDVDGSGEPDLSLNGLNGETVAAAEPTGPDLSLDD